jgi:hypothetical protein
MPSPKDIRKYTDTWLDAFKWFEEHPSQDLVVECETKSKAHSMRFEFYRARSALEKDEGYMKIKMETGFDMWENTKKRKVFIEDDCRVIFRFADETPVAEQLKRGLENAKRIEDNVR